MQGLQEGSTTLPRKPEPLRTCLLFLDHTTTVKEKVTRPHQAVHCFFVLLCTASGALLALLQWLPSHACNASCPTWRCCRQAHTQPSSLREEHQAATCSQRIRFGVAMSDCPRLQWLPSHACNASCPTWRCCRPAHTQPYHHCKSSTNSKTGDLRHGAEMCFL